MLAIDERLGPIDFAGLEQLAVAVAATVADRG